MSSHYSLPQYRSPFLAMLGYYEVIDKLTEAISEGKIPSNGQSPKDQAEEIFRAELRKG